VRLLVTFAVCVAGLPARAAPAPPPAQEERQPRFRESVTVERVLTDVRVVDDAGDAVLGLRPEDFRVKVAGRRVSVDSAIWVAGDVPYSEGLEPEQAAAAGIPSAPPRRLVVYVFQKDLERSRITGLLRMIEKAASQLVRNLSLDDRVGQAIRRLTQALRGYYLLSFEAAAARDASRSPRSLDVALDGKQGRVLFRSSLD
jgi:hypothetical protein